MATNFPASLDTLTNPTSTDSLVTVSHAGQHANANDAIEALQAKVGADNSAVATSLDYRINQLESGPAGSSITVSDTAPVSPSNGDLWFDSTSAATYVYYDSTWVEIGGATIDDPTKIENSIVDAKGDLITATADDTPARLPVGSNGQVLVADSGETTGLRWSSGISGRNTVINGSLNVWQRGTSFSFTSGFGYSADRWIARTESVGGSCVFTRESTNDTTNLPNIQYCGRLRRATGNTDTFKLQLINSFETVNSIPLAGQNVVLSFYARCGSGYSPTSNNLLAQIYTGTGTDQNFAAITGIAIPLNTNVQLTTTWQRFSLTASLASTATQVFVQFNMDPTGTAGSDDYFEVTGIQLELGNVATRFESKSYADELAECQRYYQRIQPNGTTKILTPIGRATATTYANFVHPFAVEMRIAPTALEQSGTASDYKVSDGDSTAACTVVPSFGASTTATHANVNTQVASGLTVGHACIFITDSVSTAGFLAWSAEL
jgi:hypothetical protein